MSQFLLPTRLRHFSLTLLFLTFTCCLPGQPGLAQALERNTVFLPFKINAGDSSQSALTEAADKTLSLEAKAKNIKVLSRAEAQKIVNYEGAWPPPRAALAAVAQATGASHVGLGSVTQLGRRISVDAAIFDDSSTGAPRTAYRVGESHRDLPRLTAELIGDLLTHAGTGATITAISTSGNKRIDSGAILQKIATKPGDLYNPAALSADIKAVFAMGFFDSVEVDAEEVDGGQALTFRVVEKPLINEVLITGAEAIKEEEIREAAGIGANTILNPTKVNEAVEKIRTLYKSKGYYNADVQSSMDSDDRGAASVRFNIKEGEKVVIREIAFTGNKSFSDSELRDAIQTSTRSWWISWLTGSGILRMDVLNQDMERVAAFYQNHGYLDARVGKPEVSQSDDGLSITFPVMEGPRYRVGTVDMQGDLIKDKTELLNTMQIRKEEYLNRQIMRDDIARLTEMYAEQGYVYAEINPQIRKAPTGNRIDLMLDVKQGPVVYVNRIEVQGNTRTRDNVIRRDITLEEGSKFDAKALRTSTAKLNRLDFFESVNITPKPTMREDLLDVVVDVKEKPTGQFAVGAGYSSSDQLLFMGEISERNLFGTGNKLALQANTSGKSTRYNIRFTNPRIYDSQVSGSLEGYDWTREYSDYTRDTIGGGIDIGHPLFEEWRIYYGYSLSNTDLKDIRPDASSVILRSKDIHLVSEGELSLVRDTRDKSFSPTSGSRNSITVSYAGGPLGGDAEYTKIEGSSSWYFPMVWSTVFHVKGAAGQAFENKDNKLPVFEHFYLGGMNSIRGFKSAKISPRDPVTGERIGGDKMWYVNLGIIFPLVKDLGLDGELFTDFGNVYDVDDDWDFGDYKKTAGLGINWASPLGPLRLAVGFNLDKKDDEDSSTWDFSIGGSF